MNTASNGKLPVGVLIPTRDSMSLIGDHLDTVERWIDLVEEVVVVDSHSGDRTVEILKKRMANRNVRFLSHPPGLYASWNHGIGHLSARYTYISTVGDGIGREGLVHLLEVAEKFSCDAVVSPPDFVNEAGRPVRGQTWPVHTMVSILGLDRPAYLEGWPAFATALAFFPSAILGSSASNLYRTAVIQERPFPTEFGMNGDAAWGLANALRIRLGITPRRISFFREHRRSYPLAEYSPAEPQRKFLEANLKAFDDLLRQPLESETPTAPERLNRLLGAIWAVHRWRAVLDRQRALPWPLVLNPTAWWARQSRIASQRRIEAILRGLLATRMKSS